MKSEGQIVVEFLREVMHLQPGEVIRADFLYGPAVSSQRSRYFIAIRKDSLPTMYDFAAVPEIDVYLLQSGVRMSNLEAESLRFAHILLANLQAADTRWGKDFVNHVFSDFIVSEMPLTAQALLRGHPLGAAKGSVVYEECMVYFRRSIDGLINSVRMELRYDQEVPQIIPPAILAAADTRLHLSLRAALFPL